MKEGAALGWLKAGWELVNGWLMAGDCWGFVSDRMEPAAGGAKGPVELAAGGIEKVEEEEEEEDEDEEEEKKVEADAEEDEEEEDDDDDEEEEPPGFEKLVA